MGGEWFGTYKMANVAPLAGSFPSYDPTCTDTSVIFMAPRTYHWRRSLTDRAGGDCGPPS